MIDEKIKKILLELPTKYNVNRLLTFMEDSDIHFISRELRGPVAIATLDAVLVDLDKVVKYPSMLVYFIFIHETFHMKRIKKYGKEWLLKQLSIEDYPTFLKEICKEEVFADRYASRLFYKFNGELYPWTMTQQLDRLDRQSVYSSQARSYYDNVKNDETKYRELINSFIV